MSWLRGAAGAGAVAAGQSSRGQGPRERRSPAALQVSKACLGPCRHECEARRCRHAAQHPCTRPALPPATWGQVTYEAYGIGGTGFVIECLTDNVNRSAADVKAAITKGGGKVGGLPARLTRLACCSCRTCAGWPGFKNPPT